MITAFRNAWQPFFLKIANQENARQIYARVLTYFVLGGGMLLLMISYFVRDVLTYNFFGKFHILNNPSYWDGISIIPIILLSYLFYGIYVILTPGFYIKKESKYMIVFTGTGAILNIASNMILLPLLNSFWGAAWATLISYFVMMLTIYLVANRIYPIPIEWGPDYRPAHRILCI
jgi:O-antigen/teichoic acid export membrane protein